MKVLRRHISKVRRRLYATEFWTCARCGTTNSKYAMHCIKCNNRRPY